MFHEMFLILVPGADPADRVVRRGELSNTELVPVPDAETAAAVAASAAKAGLDLIELYGGLGPKAAAAVVTATDEKVPVGLVGEEYAEPPKNLAVIFEAPNADPAERSVFRHKDGQVTVVAVPSRDDAPAVAAEFVAEGADRVELCGGMGPVPAAEVAAEVGDRVPVSTVLFGFESLPGVAAYRARFEAAAGIS